MAKYTRYDPRNKKKNRQKDQDLDRLSKKQRKVQFYESEIVEQDISKLIKDFR
jgi:hypothetical protein